MNSLLEVRDLTKHFSVKGDIPFVSKVVRAVDGITFGLPVGATMAVAGESGSGKTTLARCIMNLERLTSGEVYFRGKRVLADGAAYREMRRSVQMVFQDPVRFLQSPFYGGADS